MSGDERNVFCCRKESDNSLPPWKREILERRKAKSRDAFDSFCSAFAARLNDEIHGENGRSEKSTTSNGSFRITSASRHFAGKGVSTSGYLSPNNKPWSSFDHCDITVPYKNVCCHSESLVLSDSLGPLHENPFIKRERQRKNKDQESATRSLQHILELYGSVPGVRTIRAENIIIIESDPDYLKPPPDLKAVPKLQHNGHYTNLKDFLDRKCTQVTEVHAKEVVIYSSKLSKSEENLSTLGHYGTDGELIHTQGQGRVRCMLQRFDCNYDKLHARSRSSESLLVVDTRSDKQRLQLKPQHNPVPTSVASSVLSSELVHTNSVFQSSKSSQNLSEILSSVEKPESGVPLSALRQSKGEGECRTPVDLRFQTKLQNEKSWYAPEVSSKPKVPSSLERQSDVLGCLSCRLLPHSANFIMRPAPRPDLSLLPDDDIQAHALANLRLQSKNSFTVIPKRRMRAVPALPSSLLCPQEAVPLIKPASSPCLLPRTPAPQATTVPKPTTPALPLTSPSPPKIQADMAPRHAVTELSEPDLPKKPCTSPSPSTVALKLDLPMQLMLPKGPLGIDHLPVTNIDDVIVEPTQAPTSSLVLQRKGNTFRVVPKRSPGPQVGSLEPQGLATEQAPYAELGALLKKRYPKAEEIEVIGGYVSLSRSCLSKNPARKKLKISFNEPSLHSTFEYLSESSLFDEGEVENKEVKNGVPATERFLIPHPSYKESHTNCTSTIDNSNYPLRYSVDSTAWQEHNHDVHVVSGDCNTEAAVLFQERVGGRMLSPAAGYPSSDFQCDLALHF